MFNFYDSVYLSLVGNYASTTYLTVLAVPSIAVFCKPYMTFFISSFFSHSLNLFNVIPRVPITTAAGRTCDKFQIFFLYVLGDCNSLP